MDLCCYCAGYSPPANKACTCACHEEGNGWCAVCLVGPEAGRVELGPNSDGDMVYKGLCARHLEQAGSSAG